MQEQNYSIKQWAKDDRPREKLLAKGPQTLSDSELLAILILNGNKEKSALDLAKDVLKLGKNNLPELGKLSVRELTKVKGIGEAKAVTIVAAWNWPPATGACRPRKAGGKQQRRCGALFANPAARPPARSICRTVPEPGQ
jgi:DNA repair protein RadC